MARTNQAVNLEELWEETRRLEREVASLQERLAQQSTESPALKEAIGTWDVPPYSWAIAGWREATRKWHDTRNGARELLEARRLALHNRRAIAAHREPGGTVRGTLELL